MSGMADWQAKISIDIEDLKKRIKVAEGELDKVTKEDRKIKLDIDTKTLESAIQKLDKMLDSLGKGTGDFKQFENLSKELSGIVSDVKNLSKAFGKVDDSGAKSLLSSIQNIDRSLSELSQHILNVNKNMSNMGGNTNGAVKQVENIGNAAADAVKQVDKLAEAQSKLGGNKTNISLGDVSSQTKVSDTVTEQIIANEKKKQEAYKATADSVMYHAGVISKLNKAETNGRFYGSDRGTGYFGTGHYFVDSNTKHELDNNSNYSSLPYTSIDISKYDNLFKATSDEVADALHSFLKNLTRFTQGSDSFDVSELFSQFQKVFGETTMDMQEFDSKLQSLKSYMQKSSMDDRGDSVSTQFMKSLGYGGVDTRGTKYADTRYGTVIYDLKEESVLQANITDELQKQGQMLEKINYEKGQVFDASEDNRIQGILNQQAKAKEIDAEFNKIFDSSKLNAYQSELDSVNDKLDKNKEIIGNCSSAIETAEEDARRFAKEMAEFDLNMSEEEIADTANKNKVEYQERIDELKLENSTLETRKQELEANLDAEYKLANAARERATATVEDQMKDAFQNNDDVAASSDSVANAIKEENNALEQNTQKVKENADAKEKLANADKEVSNVNLSKYDNRLESYNKKTSGYDATIKRFDDGGWTSDTYKQRVNAVKEAVAEYESILNNLKNHPELVTEKELNKLDEKEKLIKENITAVQNMTAAEKGFTLLSGQKAMDKINSILKENSAMSREAKAQIRAWYNEIKSGNPTKDLSQILGEVQKIVNAEADAGRAGKSMMDAIGEKAWYGVASAVGTYFGFNDVFRYIGEGINTIRDLDEAMTEVRKVSEGTESQYESFQKTIASTAKEIASTNKELLNSSADFLRLGYSLDQAESLAKNATLFVNVGDGVDINAATEDMITAMKAFDIQAEDSIKIVDDYNQIGKYIA